MAYILGMPNELVRATVAELRAGFAAGAFSPSEAVAALAARILAVDGEAGAFTTTCLERAAAGARAATRRLVRSEGVRRLEGIPFAVKDLVDTAGLETSYGSVLFGRHVPGRSAEAVLRLEHAGAILLGKTATHEFGWGITTVSEHGRVTRNPWARERVAGGSSGGSAVALASFQVPLALGTDTAGSVRIPADFCGVVGFKPSHNRVSRAGVFPLAPSLDHVGVMARSPLDAELALRVLAGLPDREGRTLGDGLRGVRIGISADLGGTGLAPTRERIVELTAARAAELGAAVETIELAEATRSLDAVATIVLAEGGFVHRARGLWPERRAGYGRDVRARLERSERVGRDEYLEAMITRERIGEALAAAFERVDILLGPVAGVGPVPRSEGPGHERFRSAVMSCTAPASLAGLPACALRAGFDEEGLPVGVQLVGAAGSDLRVLAIAQSLFDATPDVQGLAPPLFGSA
jgi:aspartyl-tRNA(Asn)/glutamyl-tRNA(Gln) amidotransferase subunit A